MTDTQTLKVGADDAVEVLAPDPVWATVTNLGPDAAYYDDSPLVSALSKDGTLSVGASLSFVASKHFVSSGRSRLSVEIPDRLSWLESQTAVFEASGSTGLPLPVSGAANLEINVKEHGAVGDGVTDDTLAIQAALDACRDQGGGTVFSPFGTYVLSAQLTCHPSVNLLGELGRSMWHWTTDLGAGVSAMVSDGPVVLTPSLRAIDGMWFRGPVAAVRDGANALMQGPSTQPFDTWTSCRFDRFYSGVSVTEHHETFIGCTATNNYYGAYFSPLGSSNTFDQTFVATSLTGNSFASIGVAAGELIGTASFTKTHLGFSPYCIYKEATTVDESIAELSTFTACTFEAFGNAMIHDESFRNSLSNTVFVNCTNSVTFDVAYKAAARDADWLVEVGDILYCEFLHAAFSFLNFPGALGIVRCRTMLQTQWSDMRMAIERCLSGSKELLQATNSVIESGGRSKDRAVRFRSANAALTVGQLVFRAANSYASLSGVIPLGSVATPASGFGDTCAVYTSGIVPVNASGTIAAGDAVKPSGSSNGMVVASTGWSDGPIVGAASTAVSSGSISCDLFAP